jgi:hypothetical protein
MGFSRKSPGRVPGAPSVPGRYATQCDIMPTDVTENGGTAGPLIFRTTSAATTQIFIPMGGQRPGHLFVRQARVPPCRQTLAPVPTAGAAMQRMLRNVTQIARIGPLSQVPRPLLGRDPLPFFLARTASARPPQYVRLFFAIRAGPAPTIAAPLPSAGSPLAAKVNPMISKAKWFRPLQFGSSVKRAHDAQFRTISHKHAQPAPPRLPHRAARKIPRCRPYLNTITAKLIEYA